MEKVKPVCASVIVLILSLNFVCGQSPCPGVFDYDIDGSNIYGKIVLRPSAPVSQLVVRINFTVASQLYSNYVGRIEAENNNLLLQKYNRGHTVHYRVHFPVTSPLPKLTALTVNGDMICYGPGDVPRPNQYVTTLSLQHTSFLQVGGPVFGIQPQQQNPDPVLEFVGQYGDDAQVYTFNNIDNISNWSSGYSPYYIVNTSRPFTQQTQTHTPSRPVYDYQYNQSNNDKIQRPVYDRNQEIPVYSKPEQDPVYQQPATKPSRPVYQQPETDPVYQQPATRPPRPVYQQPDPEPVYQQPATRPPKPAQDDSFYYPQEYTTQAPRPITVITRRPSLQRPSDSSIECGVVAGGNEKVPLIYNGNPYSRGDLPWLVAIYKSKGGTLSFICGGTLVSNRHVITAAHCMQLRSELTSIKDFVVKVGVYNLNDWSDDITVTRTLISASIHESYNATTLENDILVFTFNKRVEFNTYIRPACLWNGNTDLTRIVGASGVVAGWGDQGSTGGKVGEPHMVRIPIVSTAVCRASKPQFHWLTSPRTLCAGDRNGAGPCRGDSGGGLYLLDGGKWRIRGVVSVSLRPQNGDTTCNLNEYIIFTDTAQFLPWIRKILSENYYD